MEIRITGPDDRPEIEVRYYDVTPGNHEAWTVPIGALGNRMELLGYADPVEALEATIHVLRHGEPEHDPATGKNTWTDALTLLAHREKAREAEAERCAECGDTAEVIQQKSTQAAYDAVHQPIGGGECAMDRCRREARATLGVAEPSKKCGADNLTQEPVIATMSAFAASSEPDEHTQLAEALAPYAGEITKQTRAFLHSLTGNVRDPLEGVLPDVTPPPEPEPVDEQEGEPILTAEELIAQAQEAAK